MINLSFYQTLFDIENTAERCKKVNDTMDQLWKAELGQFAAERLPGEECRIATYGQTLTTTYHDALNPKYAEQKKDSSIGRKYVAQVVQKVGEKEVNLITLEFNGIERKLYINIELSFYQVYELVKANQLQGMLRELDPELLTFTRTGSFTRSAVERNELQQKITEMIQPRARPWIYIGWMLPLEGQVEVSAIHDLLHRIWEQTSAFRSFSLAYQAERARSGSIMSLLASAESTYHTTLFGKTYQIEYNATGSEKSGIRVQDFSLKRDGQTIVQGFFTYREYEVRTASSRAMLGVDVEGHNHIYTNVEALLGDGLKDWRLAKSFRMTNQNNEELKQEAAELLSKHGFEVNHNEYLVGTYDNTERRFVEPIDVIKGNLACAALLFAHVAGRGKFRFPEADNADSDDIGDGLGGDDAKESQDLNSNFNFSVIYESIQNSPLTFDRDVIRDIHLNLTALEDKHFVILSGISGTGKTQLAKLYANAVYGLSYEADNPYLSVIPVRPDWTDGTALFGYYSSIENRYVMTEFLRMLLHAQQERDKPHFIVLDEMNLARVEYYLSDYLSGVESHKDIYLHHREDIQDVPQAIRIPPNVYLIGTINMDETTHSLSDKVLDRAFVMTLSDVDLDMFWSRLDEGMRAGLQEEFTFLKKVHRMLTPHHLHFGYRTMSEMLLKMRRHLSLDIEHQASRQGMLDRVIAEKVLPKLRGDDRIAELLAELRQAFQERLGEASVCCGHVVRMEKELTRYGATQFWR